MIVRRMKRHLIRILGNNHGVAPAVAAAIPAAISGIVGMFANKGTKKAQKRALEAQADLTREQQRLAQLQRGQYEQVGIPGYMTALQGILSSYGYRAPGQGVAGTSLGQPPTGQPPSSQDYVSEYNRRVNQPGLMAGLMSNISSQFQQGGQSVQGPGFIPGGTFGYNAGLGQQLGQSTDTYDRAKQNVLDMAQSQGLPPAMVAAALARIEQQRATQQRTEEITNQQAGPQALMAALAPALGAAGGATQAAAVGTAGAAGLAGQYGSQMDAVNAAIGKIVEFLNTKKATVPPVTTGGVVNAPAPQQGQTFAGTGGYALTMPYLQNQGMTPEYNALRLAFGG